MINKKKVLVTGADGFIGSHLVEKLVNEGCSVRAMVMYNSFNTWGWLDSLDDSTLKNIEIYPGDMRDTKSVDLGQMYRKVIEQCPVRPSTSCATGPE